VHEAEFDEILSPALPGYEPRPGQALMARAVGETLRDGKRLMVEAGTGTGKSLAYLIPLAEFSLKHEIRAVVSTHTKALQRQLIEKDLPFVRDRVFGELRFALCLGSENYLCLRRLEQARDHGLFTEDTDALAALMDWAEATEDGVREATSPELWRKVCRESDLCMGRHCRHAGRCFYQKARRAERQSHILVANHHLYFADLSTGRKALPPFGLAVFDEAHELEDVAAEHLGVEVSNMRIRHVLGGILSPQGKGLLLRLRWLKQGEFAEIASLVNSMRAKSETFFGGISPGPAKQSVRLRQKGFAEDTLSDGLDGLSLKLLALQKQSRDEEERKELGASAQRCAAAAEALRAILMQELPGHVYRVERAGRVVRLAATPVEVAGSNIFGDLDAAVFTSATLSAGGDFAYMKERLGLQDARGLLIESHFDYGRQAALYIASDLPEPNTPEFQEKAVERTGEILAITGGRTLVLFTSHSMLRMAADAVSAPGMKILRQGDAESYRLVEMFRASEDAAIFGTYTFWQGIDVPGDALGCVIITKLPFAVPDEPVAEARMEHLQRQGRDPFHHYQVPRAAIMLKQGFGRLIRTSTDRGVVAILDPRIASRPYGKILLASLPQSGRCASLEEMREFLCPAGETPRAGGENREAGRAMR